MKDKTYARNILPVESQRLFDDIVNQKILGASTHIAMIGNMIEAIAHEGNKHNESTDKILDDIYTIINFFKNTRGEASEAIMNALNIIISNLKKMPKLSEEEAISYIINVKNNYFENANTDLENVINYGVNVARKMKTILIYDYSSTVNNFLIALSKQSKEIKVIIPESRIIDGGLDFVKTCSDLNIEMKYIPDSAIMYFLKECDGAFIGAETFSPDGTAFNTTGSDIVALACKELNIPFYVLTPFIKIDVKSVFGYEKELVMNNVKNKLAHKLLSVDENLIDFTCPELLPIDSKYITAFITEKGVIPANQIYNISIDYYNQIREDTK